MDCRHVDRLMEANLDGRLSGFERVALRQHLRACATCRAKVDAMTSFTATVERTLAGADGPDWGRLAPPVLPSIGMRETAPPAPVTAPPVRAAPKKPKRQRSMWRLVLVGAAIVAVVVPFLQTRPPQPAWPLAEALAVEATRRDAGTAPDLATANLSEARAWLGARGVGAIPALSLPDGVGLKGAYLVYYDAARAAGLELETPEGPVSVHLRPGRADLPEGAPVVQADGFEAWARPLGDWQMLIIGPSGSGAVPAVAGALVRTVDGAGV